MMSDIAFRRKGTLEKSRETELLDIEIPGKAKILTKIDGQSPAMSCAIFPEGKLIAVGWSTSLIEMRNMNTFEETQTLKRARELPATSLSKCTPDGSKQLLLASYASGETVLWDAENGEEVWAISEDRQALVNDFSHDFRRLAIGGSDAKISIYDPDDQKLVQVLQGSMDPGIMDGHTMRIFATKFHPTRKFELLSGGWDDTVQFWDVRQPFSQRKIRGPHICGDGIEFFDDNTIITASWTKSDSLQMWDYGSGRLIQNIKPDDLVCFLYCCRYIADESIMIVGGSNTNMLRIIDTSSFKSLITFRNLPGAVYFAKELPKEDFKSLEINVCFCSHSSAYVAGIEI